MRGVIGKRRRDGERGETKTPVEKRRRTEERSGRSTGRRESETQRACEEEKQREEQRRRETGTRLAGRRELEEATEEGKRERRVKLLRVSCACSTLPPRPLPPPPLDRLT